MLERLRFSDSEIKFGKESSSISLFILMYYADVTESRLNSVLNQEKI